MYELAKKKGLLPGKTRINCVETSVVVYVIARRHFPPSQWQLFSNAVFARRGRGALDFPISLSLSLSLSIPSFTLSGL